MHETRFICTEEISISGTDTSVSGTVMQSLILTEKATEVAAFRAEHTV